MFRSDGRFCHLALVIYWTRGRAVSSNANALFCSGVGVAESVIAALGAGGEATMLSVMVARWRMRSPKLVIGKPSSLRRLPRLRLAAAEI